MSSGLPSFGRLGKEILALAADVIGILAAFNWFGVSGPVVLGVGFSACLFGLILASMVLWRSRNLLVRAVFTTAAVLAFLGVAYFGFCWGVRSFTGDPLTTGSKIKEVTKRCILAAVKDKNRHGVGGTCSLDFEMDAATALVIFAVAPEDRERVKSLDMIDFRCPQREIGSVERGDGREAAVLVQDPMPSTPGTVDLVAILEGDKPVAPVNLQVSFRYGTRGLFWEVKRWVFDRYP